MEERSSARHLTQRHLGEDPEEAEPSEPPSEGEVPSTEGPTPSGTETVLSALAGPSDAGLRERRRVWWQERARFEASQRPPETGDPPPP